MDMRTLVVGQDVYMNSGPYIKKGKVVRITPWGVEVLTTPWSKEPLDRQQAEAKRSFEQLLKRLGAEVPPSEELLRFHANGQQCDSDGNTYDPDIPWSRLTPGMSECGPWELDNIPFEERTALLNNQEAENEAKRQG